MRALLDSSVLLRRLFEEPNPLGAWDQIREAYASRLLAVEVGRVIDRARLAGGIDDHSVVALHEESQRVMGSVEFVDVTDSIWRRAAASMPTVVSSLDAIHLATALELQRQFDEPLVVATHDVRMARAARALGFVVLGVSS